LKAATEKYPVNYHESMNSVFTQELEKFNGLIKVLRSSLEMLKKAIKGEALLNPQLEDALNAMLLNQIPAMWLARSYPSLKKLGSYIKDLKERLEFFQEWLDNGIPTVFAINKFFFTHGFLTGAL
jgi:dynein heavy chain